MVDQENRVHLRIRYPGDDRPRLVFDYRICEVLDCSERGLRIRCAHPPLPGAVLDGRLRSPHAPEIPVRGRVVRVSGDEVAVHLDEPGIPFAAIVNEHLRHGRERARSGDW